MSCEQCELMDLWAVEFEALTDEMQRLVNNLTWALIGENITAANNNLVGLGELNDKRTGLIGQMDDARCVCQNDTPAPMATE